MTINFKNVGQGDSIILEWENNGEKKCGIIDCNRYNGGNPVLLHLQKMQIKEIVFIFLSHPHEDHFSGMLELLEYCETQQIQILRFAHTIRADPRMLQAILNTAMPKSGRSKLESLLLKAKMLRESGLIRIAGCAEVDWAIDLNSEWSIRNYSPSEVEIEQYLEQVHNSRRSELEKCSKLANLLCSLL